MHRFIALLASSTCFALLGCSSSGSPPEGEADADTGADVAEPPDAPAPAKGEPCKGGLCADGLSCHLARCSGFDCPATCRTHVSSCATATCAEDEYCEPSETTGAMVSGVCLPRAALGAACEAVNDLDVNSCVDGAFCDGTQHCVKPITSSTAPCAGGRFGCGPGRTCPTPPSLGEPSTCATPKGKGDSCSNSPDCAIGLYCDESTFRCTTRKAVGAACSGPLLNALQSCTKGALCVEGKCR